jgi:hypothetical protein
MPRPAAWASAVALYLFAAGVGRLFGFAMPILFALIHHWPRLGWLGMLLLWLSPMAIAAAIHAPIARWLGDGHGGPTSWWAGFVAWAAIIVVTMTTALVLVVLDPPPVRDPDSVWNLAVALTRGAPGTTGPVIWIVLAAFVYELELGAERGRPPRSP